MQKLYQIKICFFLILLHLAGVAHLFSKDDLVSNLLSENFSSGLSMDMTTTSLTKLYPDLVVRSGKAASGAKILNLTHRVTPSRFYQFKSLDGQIKSFQSFDSDPDSKYLFDDKNMNSDSLLSHFSIVEIKSLRITRNQVVFVQPVALLNSKKDHINIAFSSCHLDRNLIIFDGQSLSADDFFAPPNEKVLLEKHIKNIRQKEGTLASLIEDSAKFESTTHLENEIPLFNGENQRVRRIEVDDVDRPEWMNILKSGKLGESQKNAAPHEGIEFATGLRSYWQWLIGGALVMIALAYFRRASGPPEGT